MDFVKQVNAWASQVGANQKTQKQKAAPQPVQKQNQKNPNNP
jgi:hypothetical protein